MVMVLVLCMTGLLIASPVGLFFFSVDGSASGVSEAVIRLNGEFATRIEQIQEDTAYDVLDLNNRFLSTHKCPMEVTAGVGLGFMCTTLSFIRSQADFHGSSLRYHTSKRFATG